MSLKSFFGNLLSEEEISAWEKKCEEMLKDPLRARAVDLTVYLILNGYGRFAAADVGMN